MWFIDGAPSCFRSEDLLIIISSIFAIVGGTLGAVAWWQGRQERRMRDNGILPLLDGPARRRRSSPW